jgi:transposase
MDGLQLSAGQRGRLRRQLDETTSARVFRRTLAILDLDRGESAADVAYRLGVSRQTVYNWLARYVMTREPAFLAEQERPGRPTVWSERLRHRLQQLLNTSPDQCGYDATNWTVPLLREELSHAGLDVADETVRRELARLEAFAVRFASGPGAGEKNGGFAGKFAACRHGAWCWRRMKRICCCFRHCVPAGRCAASRPGCP